MSIIPTRRNSWEVGGNNEEKIIKEVIKKNFLEQKNRTTQIKQVHKAPSPMNSRRLTQNTSSQHFRTLGIKNVLFCLERELVIHTKGGRIRMALDFSLKTVGKGKQKFREKVIFNQELYAQPNYQSRVSEE